MVAVRGTARFRAERRARGAQRMLDQPVDDLVLAVDAVGVDGKQHDDVVPGAGGDLGGRRSGVQPQGQGGMPQVVGAARESSGGEVRAEGQGAGGVPGAAVDRFAEHAAARAGEQPPVRRCAVAAQVGAQHADQDGRDGNRADRPFRPVLEPALLVAGAIAGPGRRAARCGGGQGEHAPATSDRAHPKLTTTHHRSEAWILGRVGEIPNSARIAPGERRQLRATSAAGRRRPHLRRLRAGLYRDIDSRCRQRHCRAAWRGPEAVFAIPTGARRVRRGQQVWSVAEYLCHLRDALLADARGDHVSPESWLRNRSHELCERSPAWVGDRYRQRGGDL